MIIHGYIVQILLVYIVSISAFCKLSLKNGYDLRNPSDMSQSRLDNSKSLENMDSIYNQEPNAVNYLDNPNGIDRSIWEKQLDLKRSARQTRFDIKRSIDNTLGKTAFRLIDENGDVIGYLQPFSEPFDIPQVKKVQQSKRESHVRDSLYPLKKMASNLDLSSGSNGDRASIKKLTAEDQVQDVSNLEEYMDKDDSNHEERSHEMEKKDANALVHTNSVKNPTDELLSEKRPDERTIREVKYGGTSLKLESKSTLNDDNMPNKQQSDEFNMAALDRLQTIEKNLESVIEDLGLHDDAQFKDLKREIQQKSGIDDADEEDEDMEQGANKLKLVKSSPDVQTSDFNRGGLDNEQKHVSKQGKRSKKRIFHARNRDVHEDRLKRNSKELMKNLKDTDENNRSQLPELNGKAVGKVEDDRNVEMKIHDKIEAIKREIKREIQQLRTDKAQRKKRDVENNDTLLDKETKAVSVDEKNFSPNMQTLKRVKRHNNKAKPLTLQDKDYVDITKDIEQLNKDNLEKYPMDPSVVLDSIAQSEKLADGLAFKNSLKENEMKLAQPKSISQEELKVDLSPISSSLVAFNADDVVSKVNRDISRKLDKGNAEDNSYAVKKQVMRNLNQINEEKNSEDKHRSMDRQMIYKRRRRANAVLPEANIAFVPYRPEEGEVDEEADEFDDDTYDDREMKWVKRDLKSVQKSDSSQLKRERINRNPHQSNGRAENNENQRNLHNYNGINKELLHPQRLQGMSEYDIFGAFPQNYDSELVRYKRVKRNKGG